MRFFKDFGYPDVLQRRMLFYNSFSSFVLLAFIFFHTSFTLRYYSLYEPVVRAVLVAGISGIFIGGLAGRALFGGFPAFRRIFLGAEAAFTTLCLLFILRRIFGVHKDDVFLMLFFRSEPLFCTILALIAFPAGIKLHYFVKASCADFIDDIRAVTGHLVIVVGGLLAGMLLAVLAYLIPLLHYLAFLPLLSVIPSALLIRLPYSPPERIAHGDGSPQSGQDAAGRRDDLIFSYLNAASTVIYLFLGYQALLKYYGDFLHVRIAFLVAGASSLLAGLYTGRSIRTSLWHVYSGIAFPLLFIVFLVANHSIHAGAQFYAGALLFVPVSFALGFALEHTIENAVLKYTPGARFTVVNFSLLILPIPLFVVLQFLEFTNLWYFVLLYSLAAVNIALPGVHLMQQKLRGRIKLAFFSFSLVAIPAVVAAPLYFHIPMDGNLFRTYTSGFSKLLGTNLDANFIKHNITIRYNGKRIFNSSDTNVKNLQRAVFPVLLYAANPSRADDRILFINGNQRFFNYPQLSYLKNAVCLDYLPLRNVDFHRLPFTGKPFYVAESADILGFLFGNREPYGIIMDIPNLYDQGYNLFRFTEDYYRIIKKSLAPGGIFAQSYSLSDSRAGFLSSACDGFAKAFKRVVGFLYTDHLVLLGSDNENSLAIVGGQMERYRALFAEREDISLLFYADIQSLSHCMFTTMDELSAYVKKDDVPLLYFLQRPRHLRIDEELKTAYISDNARILGLFDPSPATVPARNALALSLAASSQALGLLKTAGLFELYGLYEDEANTLFQLRRLAEYNNEMRNYMIRLLAFKQEYYYLRALELERDKKWDEAGRLYRALLKTDQNNFNANYRLGILSLTLQNLDDAFQFLQKAMQLRRDDAKVLYQMGVLLFSSGRTEEAITYFNRAIDRHENPAVVHYYLGLSYEKLGRLAEAKGYYEKALLIDPNDRAVQSGLENVNKALEEERNRWKQADQKNQDDVEQGENMPLPINKSARDIRLKDSELKDYEAVDQQKGDAVK